MKADRRDDHKIRPCCSGMTRRGFLTTVGIGAVAVAASGGIAAQGGAETKEEAADPEKMVRLTLDINGHSHRLLVEPRWSLLYILRERLGLTGTKAGCERGECGACTVLMDGAPHYACMLLGMEAEGRSVTTLEGLMEGENLGPVQQAFLEHDAFQCGYCTPGQIMAVEGLLRSYTAPSITEIQRAVSGNLCRCGAYVHIFQAAKRAAELKGR